MRLKPEQTAQHLRGNKLAPVYLVSGDEPQQIAEITDAIRKAAQEAGYLEREIFSQDSGFSWNDLPAAAYATSLFADRKVIDLRLPSGSPGTEGAKVLAAYCERLPEDTLLLITSGKLTAASLKTRWFQALERVGVFIQVWPLEGEDLQRWLQQRLQLRGINTDNEGLKLLTGRIEGNLLAAAQEIEKLYILYGAGFLDTVKIADAVADSSRHDVFKLADSLLAGHPGRITKILAGLKEEDVAPPVVLWSITREARLLCKLKREIAAGKNRDAAMQAQQIWDKRKALVSHALERLSEAALHRILVLSAKADREIKGQQPGDPWQSLLQICLLFTAIGGFQL
ncbi:DNA polymerase III subunit delta [Candidatus Methylomicrobium oryzae]|jgi:DNA polymerase-3 subunit delta|uniref:DNA polymerase III subunit delta n=1 Tax=Candidatus Methylomicrobium oryzae TaxID=2802053 RepID=UPI001924A522|nr:DNA polymerase III subunit delta [Methylomicrobium sp. RS1]MBL1265514.1 DNA polymerase III subunit delta [Methylomicrobium sp. RS1]